MSNNTGSVPALAHADQTIPSHIRGYLEDALGASAGSLEQFETTDQAWAVAERGARVALAGALFSGFALRWLHSQLSEDRQFRAGCAERGIPVRTAYRMMDIARLAERLPASSVPALAHIGPTKAALIAKWPEEDAAALFEAKQARGLAFDDVLDFSTRELEQRDKQYRQESDETRKLREKNEHLAAELEARRVAEKEQRRAGLPQRETFCEDATIARDETFALTGHVGDLLDRLTRVAHEHVLDPTLRTAADEKTRREIRNAAGAMFHHLRTQVAPALVLMRELDEAFGDDLGSQLGPEHMTLLEESQRYLDEREMFQIHLRNDAKNREAQRENSKPGKRGRPRKTTDE